MPPTMTTQSVSRPATASRGGGTGGRAGRGGGRTRGRSGDQGDGRIDNQGGQVGGQGTQVGDQGRGQRYGRNQNSDAINDNNRGNVSRDCTYKEFLACNPKEYDGKGGAIVYTRWIEKMESVQGMSRCRDNQKVKYTAGLLKDFKTLTREEFCPSNEMQKLETELGNYTMVEAGHAAYIDRFHELASNGAKKTIQKAVQIAGTLTDEALRNGSIKKNPEKRGNRGEPSKDRNVRDDNKRTRTGNAFATTTNPVGRENTGHFAKDCRVVPKNVNPINVRNLTVRACYECGSTNHVKSACPRLNQDQRLGETHQNQVTALNGGQGHGNQGNQARGGAFMLGAEEARQDLNIMTGTFTLNDHYATTLFNSGADYSFVSTTFIPLLGIEPSDVVVRIPLLDGKMLRVLGEKPKEKMRQLMSAKAKEKKQEEIVVVKDFPEVFPDDLSGLPSVQKIEFQIELIPGAMPVAKSPYRLAHSELEELSGQLKEL
ncbi:reverse transcriptase domain-containing protein [Tanacetum coccineum]